MVLHISLSKHQSTATYHQIIEGERVGVLRGGGVKQQDGNKGEITNWSNDKRLEATGELFNR
jgi:hypothetical protein